MRINLKCPAEVLGIELPSDECPWVRLILMDLVDRGIASCEATVRLLDGEGREKARAVHRARALGGRPHSAFSMTVPLEPAEGAVRAEAILDKVWFEDNDVWRRNAAEEIEYEPNELPLGNELNALRYVAGNGAVGFPSQQAAVWVCVCGRPNGNAQYACARCRREKEMIFRQYGREAVMRQVSQRERQLDLKTRGAREESIQMQRIREEEWNRTQARKKRRGCLALALAAAVAVCAATVLAGVPGLKLLSADRLMRAERLENAESVLTELGSFPGAEDRLRETRLRIARRDAALVEKRDLPDAGEADLAALSTRLRETDGTQEDEALADRVDLIRAENMLKAGRPAEAEEVLKTLPKELEGRENLLLDCAWARAEGLFAERKYEEARRLYLELGAYPGAANRALDCRYEPAVAMIEAGDYDGAITELTALAGYLDSAELIQKSWYLKGYTLEAAGEDEEARQAFLTAGEYEDAEARARAIRWTQAEALMAAKDYGAAMAIYQELDGDGNAREKLLLCATEYARQIYRTRDYRRVVEILEDLPENTAEINRFRTRALYLGAKEAAGKGDLEEAIAMMERIPQYSDAGRNIRNWRIALAEIRLEAGDTAGARELLEPLTEYYNARKLLQQVEKMEEEQKLAAEAEKQMKTVDTAAAEKDERPVAADTEENTEESGDARTTENP